MNFEKLILDLKNPDYMKRLKAVENLGITASIKAIEPLISSLDDFNNEVKCAAIKSLGQFNDKRVIDVLVKTLKDPTWYVRVQAGLILEKNLKEKNRSILEFLYNNDPSKLSKLYAALGLIILGNDSDKKILKFILSLLNDDDINIRIQVAMVLSEVIDQTVVMAIFNEFDHQNIEVKQAMIYAISHYSSYEVEQWLGKLLIHNSVDIRSSAIKALEKFKTNTSLSCLIEALNDEDSYVRSCAVIALGNIGNEMAVQPLIKRLKDDDNDVIYYTKEALRKIGI